MADIVENLNELAKEVFAEGGVPDLIPNGCKLQKDIGFKKEEMLGLKYVQTVRLAYPNGFTHAKGDGTAGAFSLRGAKKGIQKRVEVQGNQILLQDQMSYEDAAKCKAGKQAFIDGTEYFFSGMQMSARKRLEAQLLYGSSNIGTVSASVADGANQVLTITAADWASGIWVGAEGTCLDAYTALGVKVNANADLVLEKVNVEDKKITVSGNAADLAAIVATDCLYFAGAKGEEMLGIHGILTTDNKFGVDGATYALWKSTSYAVGGAISFTKVKAAVGLAVAKGMEEDCKLYLSPSAWDSVATDLAALRRVDKSETKKVEVGHEQIVFYSQNGKIELIPSIYVKQGYAYGITPRTWKRIGAQDITFKTPGFDDQLFFHLETRAGVEARMYTNQAAFCHMPAKQFVMTGIV